VQSEPSPSRPEASTLAEAVNRATLNFNPADPEQVRAVVGLIRTLLNQLGDAGVESQNKTKGSKSRKTNEEAEKKRVKEVIGKENDDLWKV
jgi:hypothetical protein